MSTHTASSPCITVTPPIALLDEPVQITLSGFALEVRVTVHAQMQDDEGKMWRSQATFVSDKQGKIDLAAQKPLQGTYQEADTMGLFWSMTLNEKLQKGQSPLFVKTRLNEPTMITFTARVDEEIKATTEAKRLHIAEGVTEILVQEQGLVGNLFVPIGDGPYPGILVLSGSDGRIRERGAALLASHGYAALALVYFGSNGPFILAYGGNAQESAAADADSWQQTLSFFSYAFATSS